MAQAVAGERKRVWIVEKGGGVLSWAEDVAEGFRARGAVAEVAALRSHAAGERLCQWREGGRGWRNRRALDRLWRAAEAFRPDLVLLLNHAALPEPAARALREACDAPLVGWLCDRPRALPAGFDPVLDGVHYFDSACLPVLAEAYPGGTARLEHLPLAASARRYGVEEFPIGERAPRLAFAGYCSPSRLAAVERLRALGCEVNLHGPGSAPWWKPWDNRRLAAGRLADLYRHHLLNLNLLQPENTECGLNLRAFEIACAGGLGCYPRVADLERSFVPGEEIVAYDSLEELAEKAGRLLANPEEALSLARRGWLRAKAEHTFDARASTLLDLWCREVPAARMPSNAAEPAS